VKRKTRKPLTKKRQLARDKLFMKIEDAVINLREINAILKDGKDALIYLKNEDKLKIKNKTPYEVWDILNGRNESDRVKEQSAAVGPLREALKACIAANPCSHNSANCHCSACEAAHALSTTGLAPE